MSDLKSILFVDIETVSQYENFGDMPYAEQKLWTDQCLQSYIERNYTTPSRSHPAELEALYTNRAAIHSEFGKIIVIGVGYLTFDTANEPTLRVKALTGDDEKALLESFNKLAEKFPTYCAHNGKKFDYPYLARRMLIKGMKVPAVLDTRNKKPWEITHLDTQEMWRFGDMVYPSLEMLSQVLGIPMTKSIEGNKIGDVYRKGGIKEIADYCVSDVVALAKVFVKLQNPALNITKVQVV